MTFFFCDKFFGQKFGAPQIGLSSYAHGSHFGLVILTLLIITMEHHFVFRPFWSYQLQIAKCKSTASDIALKAFFCEEILNSHSCREQKNLAP